MELPAHPRLKFSEAGLRGVVGETLLPPLVVSVVGAFASTLEPGAVALGRDTRLSGPALLDLVAGALRMAGRDVVDLGICPVPTVEYFVKTEGLPGGIDVTASHNPAEWNALKLIGPGGYFFDRDGAARVRAALAGGTDWPAYDRMGRRRRDETAIRRHLDRILKVVDVEAIRRRRFHVAIDCVNGSASLVTPLLLEALGCRVSAIHATPDQPFPHPAEPRPQHLGDLIRLVRETEADIGFAQDPDADRLACIADGGVALSEEYTLVLASDHVLARNPGRSVAVNLSTSRMIDDVAARHGSRVIRTEIGEINVSRALRETDGVIGGEGNGGVMLPAVHACRDSFTGIALLLEMLATRNEPVGAIVAAMPSYAMLKHQEEIAPERVAPAVAACEGLAQGAEVDRRDGLKMAWSDRWLHVRGSNTEPIIRVMAEAPTESDARELIDRARRAMTSA